ncbi:YoaK family protein [Chitinimonas sp.]|uniref:YoaK family protein n=1 Tax=Chitinimonas sp. TaxID=1934313 RepID=UPI0035B427DF
MSEESKPVDDKRLAIAMAFAAGYVDTLGFIALFGLFTAHVTGNFVLIGSELARPSHGVLIKLLAFPAFILAVAATRLLVLALERRQRAAKAPVLLAQAALLVGFMLLGMAGTDHLSPQAPLAIAAGIVGAMAMGVQNAASRLVFTQHSPTTVMTGNVTQIVIDLVDIVRGGAPESVTQRARKFIWPVLAFGFGALFGAQAYVYLGFLALLLPIGVLLYCAAR